MLKPYKLWFDKKTKKEIILFKEDISKIISEINSNHSGYLRKKTFVTISNKKEVSSIFDHVVIDNYLCSIITRLGRGTFGQVFKVYDNSSGEMLALKAQRNRTPVAVKRQVQITSKYGIGKNCPKSIAGPVFLSNGNSYFLLPLADTNFQSWMMDRSTHGEYSLLIKALIKVGRDLSSLHAQKLVHMDLKLDNILVFEDIAYISDFGSTHREGKEIKSKNLNWKNYKHCDPNLFLNVSKSPVYIVDHRFDIFSYSYIIKTVALYIKDSSIHYQLISVAKEIDNWDPNLRKGIPEIIKRLSKIK